MFFCVSNVTLSTLEPAQEEHRRRSVKHRTLELLLTRAFSEEAVDSLQPLSSALGASVGGAVTLSGPLHGPVGAGGRAGTPAGPLVPHTVH